MPAMWPIYRTDEALAAVEQAVAKGLTYAGAQRDVQKAKRLAEKNPRVVPTFLKQVERKQALLPAMERGEREDPQLAAIDAAVGDGLSYAGWQNDVKKAERFALETPRRSTLSGGESLPGCEGGCPAQRARPPHFSATSALTDFFSIFFYRAF